MKVAGLWSGHDCSFCILDSGKPIVHAEYERYIREKEPKGDSVSFLDNIISFDEIDHVATCYPKKTIEEHHSFSKLSSFVDSGRFHYVGHHQAHAAHAFFASNVNDALIVTIDGGGVENGSGQETATTAWIGEGNKIRHLVTYDPRSLNIGGLWTRVTRYIFKLQNGWPYGHQAGSVMAMAALGDGQKYVNDFLRMLTVDVIPASMKPANQPIGPYIAGKDPVHPYLEKWAKIAAKSEQDKFDLAAGLQIATEQVIKNLCDSLLLTSNSKNLCIAGGVALNSVSIGKLTSHLSGRVEEIYVPPVPYDGGLSLGAAQYVWHQKLDNDRIRWNDNFTPYLGEAHKINIEDITKYKQNEVKAVNASDTDIINELLKGKIVAIFNGKSESGRRALGNRSILADPRDSEMKAKINEKVKHRQWYRPFAPSILRERVQDWFEFDVSSPYMTHVIKFKEEKKDKVPAVVHFDGTARLQTVTRNDNSWYYDFLVEWEKASGVPILLNTSFNDREPICETPQHAFDCYMGTDIDILYFPEISVAIRKVEK